MGNENEMMWWCDKCDSPVYDWKCNCTREAIPNIDEFLKKIKEKEKDNEQ